MTRRIKQFHKSIHEGTILKDRFTSEDIFERIIQVASEEVTEGKRELFFSALAAGFAITLTFLLYVTMTYKTQSHPILSGLLYPLGFLYIVLGNYQLFTENTLPPVALVLERMSSIPKLFSVWFFVLFGNITGVLIGAFFLAKSAVLSSEVASVALELSSKLLSTSNSALFSRAIVAGFIVAGVVWLDYAARSHVSRVFLVFFAFLAIPLAGLNHIVVTAAESFYYYFVTGHSLLLGFKAMFFVFLGNALGGVLLVTVVNYFQTPDYISKNPDNRLSIKDWFFSMKTWVDKKN